MGIRGAALATGIGQLLTIIVYVAFYILRPILVRVTPKALKASIETDKSLYTIGVPAILNLALPSFLISFFKLRTGFLFRQLRCDPRHLL